MLISGMIHRSLRGPELNSRLEGNYGAKKLATATSLVGWYSRLGN
jgi:hypothetical protein